MLWAGEDPSQFRRRIRLGLAADEAVQVTRDLGGLEIEAKLLRGCDGFSHAGFRGGIVIRRTPDAQPLWDSFGQGTEGRKMSSSGFGRRQTGQDEPADRHIPTEDGRTSSRAPSASLYLRAVHLRPDAFNVCFHTFKVMVGTEGVGVV